LSVSYRARDRAKKGKLHIWTSNLAKHPELPTYASQLERRSEQEVRAGKARPIARFARSEQEARGLRMGLQLGKKKRFEFEKRKRGQNEYRGEPLRIKGGVEHYCQKEVSRGR